MAEKPEIKQYNALPTLELFHKSNAEIRCIVGPVGSGKTSAATMEICYYLPHYIFKKYGIKKTRFVVVRNTYPELRDTTQRTIIDWFPQGIHHKQENTFHIRYTNGIEVELLFRSCDNPDDVKKFKSLEVTGYWIDESIEVADEIKRMLKNRIGRFPAKCPVRYGIETTNPPDVEHTTYSQFYWMTEVPGPMPEKDPLEGHIGFWQPERENEANLRPGYYNSLIQDYRDSPDWVAMYVKGEPGIVQKGKLVITKFRRDRHVAIEPIPWCNGTIYRGWDNSGNTPAAVALQIPSAGMAQVLRQFVTDKEGIVDFTKRVVEECELLWPGAEYVDYGDPAGANKFSKKGGGFTSNAKLMLDECGVKVISSDQNVTARINSIEQACQRYDGLLIDPSCVRLINGLIGGYCYAETGTPGIYQEKPEKNRFAHVCEALEYVLVKLFKSQPKRLAYDEDESRWSVNLGHQNRSAATGY